MKKWRTIIIGLAIMFFGLLCPSIESEAAREFTFIYSKCTKTYDGTNDIVLYWVPGTKNPAEFDLCYYDGWGADGAFYQGNRDISDSPIKSIDYKKGKMVLDGAWGISLAKYSDDYLSLGMWVDDGSEDGKYDFWDVKYNFKKYAGKKVTVTFDPNGGTVSQKSKKVTFAKPYGKLPTPTKKGYSFVAWFTMKNGGYRISEDWDCSPAKNHTLYARWKLKNYKITYNLNGGSKISGKTYPATYTMKKEIVLPKATKKGYTFQGWYTDKNFKNKITKIAKGSTGNKTLYAKWKANTYKVAFKANGGTGTKMTDQSFTYNAAKKALKANTYTKKGYKFVGWATSASGKVVYTNKQQVRNLTTTNNKTITLYAKWEIAKYTISYKAVPETPGISFADSQKTYTIKQSITLKKPTLKGYTLTGKWYSDKACTKAVSTTIEKGKTGNKTYYYKITSKTPIKYTITFNGNGATSGTMSTKRGVVYDEQFALPSNKYEKYGYAFVGWSTKKNGDVKFQNGEIVNNLTSTNNGKVTLYACWKINDVDESGDEEKEYKAYLKSQIKDKVIGLKYNYSNQYFSETSVGENSKIAKASIALASAAYNESYIIASLNEMGFKDINTYNYNKVADMGDNDFVAYTIAKRQISINGVSKNLVTAIVRGTTGNAEWYSNINIGENSYHEGFYTAAKEIQTELMKYLDASDKENNILWITGHSRGAAVANIVAGEYTLNDKYAYYVQPENIYGYTFACPTVSTDANTTLTNIYNYCNEGDIIVELPLEKWGYKRYGKTVNIESKWTDVTNNFASLTGLEYEGFMSKDGIIEPVENYIPSVEEFYKDYEVECKSQEHVGLTYKATIDKHRIIKSLLTFGLVSNATEADKRLAKNDLENALGDIHFTTLKDLINSVCGSGFIILDSSGLTINTEIESMKTVKHSHCQELYYSWMCAYYE